MKDLLLKGKGMVDRARAAGEKAITSEDLVLIQQEYARVTSEASQVYMNASEAKPPPDNVGRAGFNLLRRLLKKENEALYFMRNLTIPFSNNLAEQDLRMEKMKQKINRCFQTFFGRTISYRARSYISTARRQGWNIIEALTEAVAGFLRLLLNEAQPIISLLIASSYLYSKYGEVLNIHPFSQYFIIQQDFKITKE